MKTIVLSLTIICSLSFHSFAQNENSQIKNRLDLLEKQVNQRRTDLDSLNAKIKILKDGRNDIKRNIIDLNKENNRLIVQIDSLYNLLRVNKAYLTGLYHHLNKQIGKLNEQASSNKKLTSGNSNSITKLNSTIANQKQELIGQISATKKSTSQSVSKLDSALSRNTLYWIIAVLAVVILLIIAFVFLRKRMKDNQSSVFEKLADTRKELDQEALQLDEKLVKTMDTQLKIIREERKEQPERQNGEQDHSLALKVVDEIVRIEKNLSHMEKGTRGLKQLSRAVGRIKDNFASNGYEMVDMIGKSFDNGMKLTANFILDESLEPGQKIITRIIKPQVNYKGEMIQSAQVEVSQG
jgi:chromosome segregation ATPase